MNNLVVNGKIPFMGKEIPVVLGGFGPNRRSISDKTVAEIHEMKTIHVRELITNNIKRFVENIDFIDLKKSGNGITASRQGIGGTDTSEFLTGLGYSKQMQIQAEHIYILSERGYAKLIKIMDTDLAWKIHDKLIDEYFEMREEKRQALPMTEFERERMERQRERNRIMEKNSANRSAQIIDKALSEAGVSPKYKVLAIQEVYAGVGLHFLIGDAQMPEKYQDATSIADALGLLSKSGKPHAHAVSAIIEMVGVKDGESIRVPCIAHSGHADSTMQYSPAVVERVSQWLEDRGYPAKIVSASRGMTYTAAYRNSRIG